MMDLQIIQIMTKEVPDALLSIDGKYSREMPYVTMRRLMRNLPIVQNGETLKWIQHHLSE